MKRSFLLPGAIFGLMTSLALLAITYLGNIIFGLPFLPFDLFDWLTRNLPGAIIEGGIRTMVAIITSLRLGPTDTTAKLAEQIQALGVVMMSGILFGLLMGWMAQRRRRWLLRAGILGGLLLWAGTIFTEMNLPQASSLMITGVTWLLIILVGWGWLLFRLLDNYARDAGVENASSSIMAPGAISRRNFLALAGSSAASIIILVIGLAGFRRSKGEVSAPVSGTPAPSQPALKITSGPESTSGNAASPSADLLAKRIEPAPGTREEITPASSFYRIDIDAIPPKIDAKSWNLLVNGMVQKPTAYTLEDIMARPNVTQALTLSCISNPVGGDLIGTNFWTGVRLKDILAETGLKPEATWIAMTGADGFFEAMPLAEAMDERTLLVFAMNNQPLLPEHGFPLRVFIPNHYGMKQPKWLTRLEATNKPAAGYWVERGWNLDAIPKTTSVIDTENVDKNAFTQSGIMSLGGIAWAGVRGIQKVEVKIDDAPWVEAELRNPPVSPLTWVQWRYDWKASSGSHSVSVRATDGSGTPQDTASP